MGDNNDPNAGADVTTDDDEDIGRVISDFSLMDPASIKDPENEPHKELDMFVDISESFDSD